jgi:hypothetical protein
MGLDAKRFRLACFAAGLALFSIGDAAAQGARPAAPAGGQSDVA